MTSPLLLKPHKRPVEETQWRTAASTSLTSSMSMTAFSKRPFSRAVSADLWCSNNTNFEKKLTLAFQLCFSCVSKLCIHHMNVMIFTSKCIFFKEVCKKMLRSLHVLWGSFYVIYSLLYKMTKTMFLFISLFVRQLIYIDVFWDFLLHK